MMLGASIQNTTSFVPQNAGAGFAGFFTEGVGSEIVDELYDRYQNVCFSANFTGLDGQGGGLVYELGGAVSGIYIGFRTDGTFVARAGSGEMLPNSQAAVVELPAGTIQGDGGLDVLIEMDGRITLSVFWNGWQQSDSVTSVDPSATWSGTSNGVYLLPHSGNNIPEFEVGNSVPLYTSASDLRVYQ